MVKGSLQWRWSGISGDLGNHLIEVAKGIPSKQANVCIACQFSLLKFCVAVSRNGPPMEMPKSRTFVKSLNDYYTEEKAPNLALQELFYTILYFAFLNDEQGRV